MDEQSYFTDMPVTESVTGSSEGTPESTFLGVSETEITTEVQNYGVSEIPQYETSYIPQTAVPQQPTDITVSETAFMEQVTAETVTEVSSDELHLLC